jgi:hypothetical protein
MSRSKKVALGGVLGALCMVSLYLASYLPTNRIFFYGVSSIFSAVILVEAGANWAWTFYGATALLGLAVIPNKLGIVPYVVFFGIYGIIKYYIEGLRNTVIEIVLKGVFFALAAGAVFLIVRELFMAEVYSKLPLWALAIAAFIVFYIYDYAYTRFVIYYELKLRKRI